MLNNVFNITVHKNTILPGAVVAHWERLQTLNREVHGSNLLTAAVGPFGNALYPHCLVPQKGLNVIDPQLTALTLIPWGGGGLYGPPCRFFWPCI